VSGAGGFVVEYGAHEVEFVAPDFVITHIRGDLSVAQAAEMADAMVAFASGRNIYSLGNLGQDAQMSGEARKVFVERMKPVTVRAMAALGGSFQARIILRFLDAALRLLSRNPTRLGFFEDAESARAWLREQGCIACGALSAPDRAFT